jgi:hypothetical protein
MRRVPDELFGVVDVLFVLADRVGERLYDGDTKTYGWFLRCGQSLAAHGLHLKPAPQRRDQLIARGEIVRGG